MAESSVGLKLAIGGVVASSFVESIDETKDHIDALKDQIKGVGSVRLGIKELAQMAADGEEGTEAYKGLAAQLKRSGVQTEDLKESLSRVNKELVTLKKLERIDIKVDDAKKQLTGLKEELMGTAKYYAAITGTLYVNADVKQAQGELASLGVSAEGIDKVSKAARDFSNQWAGVTTPEFIRASYDVKSSIASLSDDAVAKFTEVTARTSIAAKMSMEETTKALTMHYNKFRNEFVSDDDYAEGFSNAFAAAVQSFNISGSELTASLENIGIDATHMGVTLTDQLSVLGSVTSVYGNSGDAIAGYKAVLENVTAAQDALGLKFTDSTGKMLPMGDILEKLEQSFEGMSMEEMHTALSDAFGNDDAVKMMSAMIGKSGELKGAYAMLNEEMQTGNKASAMADSMQMGKEFTMMKQQALNVVASLGGLLYPAFKVIAAVIGTVLTALTSFIENNKKLCTVIASVAGALLAYKTASTAIRMAMLSSRIASMMFTKAAVMQAGAVSGLSLKTKIAAAVTNGWTLATKAASIASKLAVAGAKALAIGIRIVGLAMAANPIGIVLMAVAGIIALIVFNWDKVKAAFLKVASIIMKHPFIKVLSTAIKAWAGFVSNMFNKIKAIASMVFDKIKSAFSGMANSMRNNIVFQFLTKVFKAYLNIVITGFKNMKNMVMAVGTWIKDKLCGAWNAIGERFTAIIDFIKEKISWVTDKIDAVKNKAKAVAGFLGFGDDDEKETPVANTGKGDIIQAAYSQNSQTSAYKNNAFNITLGDINVSSTDGVIEPANMQAQVMAAVKDALKQIEWQTNNRRLAE